MANYWIKLYLELLDDPKMATLPDRLWRRTVELFLLAGKFSGDGNLPETKQLAWCLRQSTDDLEGDLVQIQTTGIIQKTTTGWLIPKYAARQASIKDVERKRQQRDREHSQQYHGDVTDLSRNVTQNTDTDTDTEKELNGRDIARKIFKIDGDEITQDAADFLDLFQVTFNEKFKKELQWRKALNFRGIYGEAIVKEAAEYYALKGISLGDALSRMTGSLPTWGTRATPVAGKPTGSRSGKLSNMDVVKQEIAKLDAQEAANGR